MSLKSGFELLAQYNQWMHENIYSAASTLDRSELTADRGAFFKSVIGTLNHLMIGDTIWLKRFAQHLDTARSLGYVRGLETPRALDEILYEDLEAYHRARQKLDGVIIDFAAELTDEVIESTLHYRNIAGHQKRKHFGQVLLHFFNHQTHHRGQVTTRLSQAGADVGVTDLLMRIPDK